MTRPALIVEHLQTEFVTRAGTVKAVNDVSFSIAPGKVLGLVGESGSGKSMTAYSIMGLVDPPGRVVAGRVRLGDIDLRALTEEQMRKLRGDRIAMIFQDPMMTLNPVLRIDTQMVEAIRAHRQLDTRRARAESSAALGRVGIPSPEEKLYAYPHQLSGGMRQRVAIAIALLNKPDLLIADEPTTALDVTTQRQILLEMQQLQRESGTAMLWITHDLAVVANIADDVGVMVAGRIVEHGPVRSVLIRPTHPYTRALLDAIPGRSAPGTPLPELKGNEFTSEGWAS
jgi:peptide/nickel transport system ATP-binding protein